MIPLKPVGVMGIHLGEFIWVNSSGFVVSLVTPDGSLIGGVEGSS